MAMNTAFFNAVRRTLFEGKLTQEQVEILNAIGDAWQRYGDRLGYDQYRLAYVLATAYHETGRFRWLKEIWGPTAAQKRYEGRADLGNTVAGDGKKFMGRGLVHITGRRNYADWSRRLGLDLLKEPHLAEDVSIAARILVEGMVKGTFTGKKLQDYINSDQCDFVGARRIVNGTDKAKLIAGYAEQFSVALGLASTGVAPATPEPAPSAPDPKPKSRGFPWPIIIVLGVAAAALFVITQVRF
jgi:putative chitinase